MSEKTKAKKLAAAKKRLKEYQSECSGNASNTFKKNEIVTMETYNLDNTGNIEEKEIPIKKNLLTDYSNVNSSLTMQSIEKTNQNTLSSLSISGLEDINNHHQVNAIEVLIAEKANLTSELTKQQTLCKEKLLEVEELKMQLQMITKRNEFLENDIKELHMKNSILKNDLSDANNQLQVNNSKYKELAEHLQELKNELNEEHNKNENLEKELKNKICELELSQIRISQISDEACIANDNRVEALTQTKFMYEQQIRDLQSMVQQLTSERDQANQQYQNYVQHLNKEMKSISEKNSELSCENERLVNREKSLIEHIASFEKQIQDNLMKQETLKDNINQVDEETLASLEKEKSENSELKNKIQLQQNEIKNLTTQLDDKNKLIDELTQKIENIMLDQPNNGKLLATMESDKIAASRALTQNEKLKKQLEEVEQKLIQVTNDKVELVNLLDSEQYKNRKIRENYEDMESKLHETNEKLHFKDEEMIRLTHEQNELNKIILQLNQKIDRLMHYEAKEYMRQQAEVKQNLINKIDENDNLEHLKKLNNYNARHDSERNCEHNHEHDDDNSQDNIENKKNCGPINNDGAVEEVEESGKELKVKEINDMNSSINNINNIVGGIPNQEAMEKLQERFKKIICEMADLSDEKQHLEHIVCQLQSETETIGEYITLYQTQRRLLKQREIEKSTQLHMLLQERNEMKEKILSLTQLVENLISEIENKNTLQQVIPKINTKVIDKTINNGHFYDNFNNQKKLNDRDTITEFNEVNKIIIPQNNITKLQSNPILAKINNIITEIKEKDYNLEMNLKYIPSVDHCACCSGKFETI